MDGSHQNVFDGDTTGHGTAIASLIAAGCNDSIGICGVAPYANIHLYSWFYNYSSPATLLNQAAADGITIENFSLGWPTS